jgi:hypothetical protein
MWRQTELDI